MALKCLCCSAQVMPLLVNAGNFVDDRLILQHALMQALASVVSQVSTAHTSVTPAMHACM